MDKRKSLSNTKVSIIYLEYSYILLQCNTLHIFFLIHSTFLFFIHSEKTKTKKTWKNFWGPKLYGVCINKWLVLSKYHHHHRP